MIFRRRRSTEPEEPTAVEQPDVFAELETDRPRGPWDRSETTVDEDDDAYVDLGGLVVKGRPGLELRLQADEKTGAVATVMLAGPESGLELRVFAAPRTEGIWADVRKDIAAEAARRGGTATEVDGEFGTEVKVVMPMQTPDGRRATQPSRIVGVEGPRWLLRGSFLGKSAREPDPEGAVESAFKDVIVVRGDGPMSPRESLPLHMPAEIRQQLDPAAASDDPDSGGTPTG